MKILLIQLRRIGDILLTTPCVSFLKDVFPKGQIDVLTDSMGKAVYENNPHIQDHLIYDRSSPLGEIRRVRERKYDAVIDLMGNPRTTWLTASSQAKWKVGFQHWGRSFFYNVVTAGLDYPEYVPKRKLRLIWSWLEQIKTPFTDPGHYRPSLFLTEDEKKFAEAWGAKEKQEGRPIVILAPAHRHLIRQWRPDGFRDVALDLIQKHNSKVFLAWGPGEDTLMNQIRKGHEDEIHLLPPTTLRQMAALFTQARVVCTNDSGAMHLAVSVGTPTVTLYGPTRPIDWNPSLAGGKDKIQDVALIAKEVACLGCHLGRCDVGHLCMNLLKSSTVTRAVSQFIT